MAGKATEKSFLSLRLRFLANAWLPTKCVFYMMRCACGLWSEYPLKGSFKTAKPSQKMLECVKHFDVSGCAYGGSSE